VEKIERAVGRGLVAAGQLDVDEEVEVGSAGRVGTVLAPEAELDEVLRQTGVAPRERDGRHAAARPRVPVGALEEALRLLEASLPDT
jgi:hypothetical protein